MYFGGVLGFIPLMVGASLLSTALQPDQPDIINRYPLVGMLIFFGCGISSIVASFKYLNFKCPRCGEGFCEARWSLSFNRCPHCGLKVGENDHIVEQNGTGIKPV